MTGLSIIGYGMWTAAGHDGPASVAAMQAGVPGSTQVQLWDHTAGALLNGCQVSAHQWWSGETFLPEMVIEVLRQCHAQTAALDLDPQKLPILLTVAPQTRPARTEALERLLFNALQDHLGHDLPPGSGIHPGGRTGVATLLRNAATAPNPVHILIGVESLLQQKIIDHYIDQGRLLCGANSSGFIPGEAAAGVILAKDGVFVTPSLRITGIGEGHEPEAPADQPAVTGLTTAMRTALKSARAEMYEIGAFFSDLNGEHAKFKELSIATIRLDRIPPEKSSRRPRNFIEHWNATQTIGEVGAALIPAAMAWAFEAAKAGSWPTPKVMFVAGEDDGTRIALIGEFIP